jgi:2-hydroxychromene-2-carboxylate isomerase
MAATIDYYLTPLSPYVYLGHARFVEIARAAGATVNVLPIDLGGKVFPVSGGLPLPKRAPQRQAYRLLELRRFSQWLGLPMNLQPRHFPVPADDASRLLTLVALSDGSEAALRLTGAMSSAVWAEERDLSDHTTLAALLQQCGLPAARLSECAAPEVQARYEAQTQRAIDAGIFGAPSYVVDGELFWGQDRLDFVQRKLG